MLNVVLLIVMAPSCHSFFPPKKFLNRSKDKFKDFGRVIITKLLKNVISFMGFVITKGIRFCIFSRVQPSYEQVVSDLDRSMHIFLRVQVAQSSFIEGSHMTKNMASAKFKLDFCRYLCAIGFFNKADTLTSSSILIYSEL
jgi:hypothetical protein